MDLNDKWNIDFKDIACLTQYKYQVRRISQELLSRGARDVYANTVIASQGQSNIKYIQSSGVIHERIMCLGTLWHCVGVS